MPFISILCCKTRLGSVGENQCKLLIMTDHFHVLKVVLLKEKYACEESLRQPHDDHFCVSLSFAYVEGPVLDTSAILTHFCSQNNFLS